MYPVLTERRLDKLVDPPHDTEWVNPASSAITPTQISAAIDSSGMKPLLEGNGEGKGSENCIDGLVQDCSITIANAMEILQSCTKPSVCFQRYG